ncbi:MAG TPA: hypothetical protein PKC23_05005 [Candidatus Desulfobacillus sp.]|nr:hypothetical protein [Candidatus Desulfobacillus sp.]
MRRLTDFIISLLATLAAFLLSLPFWRDFGYFAESRGYWLAYFVLGFILAVYVFYTFIGSLRILFRHARDEALTGEAANEPGAQP